MTTSQLADEEWKISRNRQEKTTTPSGHTLIKSTVSRATVKEKVTCLQNLT